MRDASQGDALSSEEVPTHAPKDLLSRSLSEKDRTGFPRNDRINRGQFVAVVVACESQNLVWHEGNRRDPLVKAGASRGFLEQGKRLGGAMSALESYFA